MLKFMTVAAACALLTSACVTGRITLYPSNAELNQLAIKKASDVVKEMPAKHGATVAIIPASGLRSFNEYLINIEKYFFIAFPIQKIRTDLLQCCIFCYE